MTATLICPIAVSLVRRSTPVLADPTHFVTAAELSSTFRATVCSPLR